MKNAEERVKAALAAMRRGQMVILVDDEDRENEGDLCVAAELVTPDTINFMATHGRGLICLALTPETIETLKLPMMVRENQARLGTAFTVSIEAREGVSTGISAKDRATTIQAAVAKNARPDDLVSPGHIFPLRARPGGVLVRTGQTEGSVDLARLAGLSPSAVICEIMRDDGEMARMPDLERFAADHAIEIVSIADLIAYRLEREKIVRQLQPASELRPPFLGEGPAFETRLYGTDVENTEYLALIRGDVAAAAAGGEEVLVRVQTVCPIGDTLATRADLGTSLRAIDEAELGVFLYVYNRERTRLEGAYGRQLLHQRPRAVGAVGIESEALRDFGLGAQVLADIGCEKIRLMSNSDRKIVGIQGFGIDVVERIPIPRGRATLTSIDGGKGAKEK